MIIKRNPEVGRYIVSDKSYKKGDEITISECIPLVGNQMPRFATGSPLWQYVFQGLEPSTQLVSLDWTSLMNHSEDANVGYEPISSTQIKFWAAKDIAEGEELTINYGYDPLQHHQEVHSNMDDWNAMTAGETLHDAMGAMAPSMGGNEISNIVNTPDFTVLSKIRKGLEGAPRTVKGAFNTVLNYFETSSDLYKIRSIAKSIVDEYEGNESQYSNAASQLNDLLRKLKKLPRNKEVETTFNFISNKITDVFERDPQVYFDGKCPATGCIEQDKEGNWRIISNKTGEYWSQKYESNEAAEAALAAYHANRSK